MTDIEAVITMLRRAGVQYRTMVSQVRPLFIERVLVGDYDQAVMQFDADGFLTALDVVREPDEEEERHGQVG